MMQRYSGPGILSFSDSIQFSGLFDAVIVGNGEISARFSPERPFSLYDRVAQQAGIFFNCQGGSTVSAANGLVVSVGKFVRLKLPNLKITNASRANTDHAWRYEIANCVYSMGSHQTVYPNGGGWWNAIEIRAGESNLRIVKIPTYDRVVSRLSERKSGGVTASLDISGPTDACSADALANAVCNLFSFATKNTVRWISREHLAKGAAKEIEYVSPAVYPIRELRAIIPSLPVDGIHPLHSFLQATIPRYTELDTLLGLDSTIGWLIEAEFSMPVQARFILAFIVAERIRSRIFRGPASGNFLGPRFSEKLDGALGAAIIALIDTAVGPLGEERRRILLRKLKGLNRPTITDSIDTLCDYFKVKASAAPLAQLRNRLTHVGDLGDLEFKEAMGFYFELSHMLDVILLKAMGYKGHYQHHATKWKQTALA